MSIVTQAPGWLLVFCLLAGVVYAGALYFRDRFNRTYGTPLATLLGVVRFLCISLLALFLLKPLIKIIQRSVEKPIIVIAQDNTESLVVGKDSSYYLNEYRNQLNEFVTAFGEDYDVRTFTFGQTVHEGIDSLNYEEQLTDYSGFLEDIYTRFSGRNLGAVVIASDGLYNKGTSPVYSYKKLNVPVYTIALGDTTVHKDALIANVAANRLAYLGNRFPMEITVEGRKAAGETVTLTVSRKGNTLHTQTITFADDRSFQKIPLTLEASEVGLQRYTISISRIADEVTYANNSKEVFIDVLDNRQKILILAYAPHPDIQAIRSAIAVNQSYRVDVKLAKEFNGNLQDYSLVIWHQLPALGGIGSSVITSANEKKIPGLFVWGASTDFNTFNALNLGLTLNNYRNNSTDIGGSISETFSTFNWESNFPSLVRMLPPMQVPFGDLSFSPGVQTAIVQQVGTIKTAKPLVAFNEVNENKYGFVLGEGLWSWRSTAFQQSETHEGFNELITKSVQYLASKDDKSLFRVNAKNDFVENENIVFNAELYNASYEPIAGREISMVITNESGQEFNYLFSANGDMYQLGAGRLPVGNYSYRAKASSEGEVWTERGEFSVSELQLETVNTIADHRLLNQFARENNGQMVYPSQMQQLIDEIRNKKEIVSIAYENKELDELINFRWLAAVIIILLSTEWLLRKRAGTY
ncbi:MAG: hypothetical protein ACKOZM_00705 [Flavobacteriales bacterium]